MNRAIALTLCAAAVWALGGVWYYNCKIKRVCGPEAASARGNGSSIATAPAAPRPGERSSASTPVEDSPAAPVVDPSSPMLVLTVSFDARSATLVPPADAPARLATLRKGIAEGRRILVLGHSDGRGARSRIAVVSQERADALRDWLLSEGIPANAIVATESREDREPIASNSRDEGRRLNRRAEAVLIP